MAIDLQRIELVLYEIGKRDSEVHGWQHSVDPQEHGVAFISEDDQEFIPAVKARMRTLNPTAKVALLTMPDLKDPKTGRKRDAGHILLAELCPLAGWPRPRPTRTHWLHLELTLPALVFSRVDLLVVDHAERLDVHCVHLLRRDRGMSPVILVSRGPILLETLRQDELLLRRSNSMTDVPDAAEIAKWKQAHQPSQASA